jgi:cytochrome c
MDSFEFNKLAGAVLFTLLIVLGTSMVSSEIFRAEKPEKAGYELAGAAEKPAAGAAAPAAAQVAPIAVRLASAAVAKGEQAIKKCASCHSFDKGGANKVGPNLYNIVEKTKGAASGFAYSAALKERAGKGEKWGYDELDKFLANPKGYITGTSMAFAGVNKPDERADIIAYLRSLSDAPAALPKP